MKCPDVPSNGRDRNGKKCIAAFRINVRSFQRRLCHIGKLHKAITPITEYVERDEALVANLSALRMTNWLLYVTAELAFNELVDSPRYWYPVDNGYRYDPSHDEKAWMSNFFQMDKD